MAVMPVITLSLPSERKTLLLVYTNSVYYVPFGTRTSAHRVHKIEKRNLSRNHQPAAFVSLHAVVGAFGVVPYLLSCFDRVVQALAGYEPGISMLLRLHHSAPKLPQERRVATFRRRIFESHSCVCFFFFRILVHVIIFW